MSNKMLEAAIEYASKGWQIFPCKPRTKIPCVAKGVNAATTDRSLIKKWWERWPDANIALACGDKSGVYVVDIDNKNTPNGWDSLKNFPDFPLDTLRQNTPSGGAHFFFVTDKAPSNKNNFRNDIDIRSNGYYVMLAPSVHPNGGLYEFVDINADKLEFPDYMRPENEKRVPPWRQKKEAVKSPKQNKPVDNNVWDRALMYFEKVPVAVQGSGGHDSLMWAARVLVHGFEMDDTTALKFLWQEYNPRCIPPWDQNNNADVKDFERKVLQCHSTPCTKPVGWANKEMAELEHTLVDFADDMIEILLNESKDVIKTKKAKKVNKKESRKKLESAGIPEFLYRPPGLVGEIASWMNRTAIKDQPFLSVGCSLALCGALMGRKLRDELNNRTNLYVMSVAPSSAGKNHARRQTKRLLQAANATEILGGEEVTSAAAIEKRLEDSPCTIFLWDEIGHFMKSLKTNQSDANLASIRPILMKLYSSASDIYSGKEYATERRKEIDQPCCCIYGTTTPEKLAEGITPDEIEDGWLGRVLCFISNDRPRKDHEKAKNMEIPEVLITQVQSWLERRIEAPEGTGDILAETECHQLVVKTTQKAEECFMDFDDLCYREEENPNNMTKGISRLWGKAEENARKIALILAGGDDFSNPEIDVRHAEYACTLVEKLVKQMAVMADEHVTYGKYDKDKQTIFRLIKSHGEKGILKRDITNNTRNMSPKQREDCLKDLLEAVVIVGRNVRKGSKGRPQMRYYIYPYGLS